MGQKLPNRQRGQNKISRLSKLFVPLADTNLPITDKEANALQKEKDTSFVSCFSTSFRRESFCPMTAKSRGIKDWRVVLSLLIFISLQRRFIPAIYDLVIQQMSMPCDQSFGIWCVTFANGSFAIRIALVAGDSRAQTCDSLCKVPVIFIRF